MDFSNVVKPEQVFPIDIKLNGESTGIIVNVVSAKSKRVIDAVSAVTRDRFKREAAGDDYDLVAATEAVDRATIISAIDSWEFNGHAWGDLGIDPPCNAETKSFLYGDTSAYWVIDQIRRAVENIENFTDPKSKPVPKPSKRK